MENKNTAIAQKNQSILRASEFVIKTMKDWRKEMLNPEYKHQQAAWVIGGLIVTLVSQITACSQDIIMESSRSVEEMNAKKDLEAIRNKFNQLIDNMIDGIPPKE